MTGRDERKGMWGSGKGSDERKSSFFAPVPSEGKEGRNVDLGQQDTERHLDKQKEKLGLLDRIRFDKMTKQEIRKQLGEVVVNMLEAQKQKLLYEITLNLDEAKKKLFVEKMKNSAELDKEMTRQSTEFQSQLIEFGLDTGLQILKGKQARLDRVEEQFKSGAITEKDYRAESANVERWTNLQRDNLDGEIELKIRNHIRKVESALELFKEREFRGAAQ
jgi:hypothetical protein